MQRGTYVLNTVLSRGHEGLASVEVRRKPVSAKSAERAALTSGDTIIWSEWFSQTFFKREKSLWADGIFWTRTLPFDVFFPRELARGSGIVGLVASYR